MLQQMYRQPIPIPSGGTDIIGFRAKLVGVTSLLMHSRNAMRLAEDIQRGKVIPSPEEEAEAGAYRHPEEGWLYIPAEAVYEAMKTATKGMKITRLKTKISTLIAAGVFLVEPYFPLFRNGELIRTYDRIDTRRVVIQKKSAVLRSRPLVETPWEVTVHFALDREVIHTPETVVQALVEAGLRIGLCDYRPEKGGSFGRFSVAEAWIELEG